MTPCDVMTIQPGDRLVLAFPDNGYEYQMEQARKIIDEHGYNPVFTLKAKDVGSWSTALYFEELPGSWNSVQFAEEGQKAEEDKPELKKFRITRKEVITEYVIVEAGNIHDAYELSYDSDLNWNYESNSMDYSIMDEI